MAETTQETTAKPRGRHQRKIGFVVSARMDKTVRVAVERLVPHVRYRKRLRRTSTFMAHDEANKCQIGDKVMIIESRPLSRRKRWRVTEILEQAADAATGGAKKSS